MAESDVLELQRRKLGDQLRGDLTCDTCGVPATMVHLLPGCVDTEEVALTGACDCRTEQVEDAPEEVFEGEEIGDAPKLPQQLDCGYQFPIREWSWEFSHETGASWSMRDQLSEKIRGERAIAMVDQRLRTTS
jgi:hypothetical protein